jgi:AraC-like DNA-binding protein
MDHLSRETRHFDLSRAPQMTEAFRQSIDPLFAMDANDIEPTLDLGLEAYNAGVMLIGRTHMRGARFDYQRDRAKIASSGLETIMLQIITKGSDVRLHDGEAYRTSPGDICIDDLTRPFATQAQDCENISIVLPRAALGLDTLQLDRIHGLTLNRHSLAAQLVHTQARAILDQFCAGNAYAASAQEVASAARATALMIGGLTEPLVNAREAGPAGEAIEVAMLYRVQRHIQAQLTRPDLTPEGIARAMGLSRASLYRLFAPLGGVSAYIRRQRLGRVFADLRNPRQHNRSIAEIAYGWGFVDWSSFSRAFKAAFDMTPSEARGLEGPNPAPPVDNPMLLLPQWLRALEDCDMRQMA